ncbi:putative ribonuclease H-like domain-containing protein, partial [Tanacetum coccineum]
KNEGEKPNKNIGLKTNEKPVDQEDQAFLEELERLKRQEKEANDAAEALRKEFAQDTKDLLLQAGAARATMTDFTNLETIVNVSPIPTSRIHSINPSTQILGWSLNKEQDLPYRKKAIGTKWVYINKKDERGVVVINKARLVAQGYRQEEGIDYDEVFSHVARIEAIRIFLAFASYMGFIVYQMNVKSAFLYGKIDEKVYVSQPPGFVDPKFPRKVYKVVKALYGLHQAPKAWYATLSTFLLKSGYRRGTIDKTLFIKKDKNDIMLVQMSSMGELAFFLGLQVKQKEDDIFISQDKYVTEILKKFDFVSVKTASTPIETQKSLTKDEEAVDVDVPQGQTQIGLWYLELSHLDLEAPRLVTMLEQILTGNPQQEVVNFLARDLFHGSERSRQLWLLLLQRQNSGLPLTCSINYALTVSPTIYASYIEQFWNTATSKTVNSVKQIHAIVNDRAGYLPAPFNDTYETPCHTKKVFTKMARKGVKFSGKVTPLYDSMLVPHQAPEGEGSEQPTKPQPTPSPTYPSIGDQPPMTDSSSSHDTTQDSKDSFEDTNGSEGTQVQSSHDSPLLGDHTSEKAEGGLNLEELFVLCTNLSNRVLALETSMDAQAVEILKLKDQIKNLKRELGRKEYVSKQGRKNAKPELTLDAFDDLDADGRDYMETEDVVKEGRQSNETEELNKGSGEKGGSTEELVSMPLLPKNS